MGFKTTYANSILKKRVKSLKRDISVFNFEKAKSIGILWDTGNEEALSFLLKKFDRKEFEITTLCFNDGHEGTLENSFNPKETNWLGFPKSQVAEGFINTEFDLLMNISLDESFPMEVITALSKARFKIGSTGKLTQYFDLSIDISKNPNPVFLAEQQLFYLKKLKINNQ